MDREVVETKLESLRGCVQRIIAKTPTTPEQLALDADLQDIIALNLQRAVQLCVDLATHIIAETDAPAPSTMAENFQLLQDLKIINPQLAQRLRKAVGFRNIAVHSYRQIDWDIVFRICRENVNDFIDFAKAIAVRLE